MKKKTNSDKKFFGKFSEVPKFRYFLKVMCKTMFFTFRTHFIYWPFASNAMSYTKQQLLLCYQIPQLQFRLQLHPCWTVRDKVPVSSVPYSRLLFVRDITITSALIGNCLYGTLLLRPRWTACPVQIRAHHHIDVYISISIIHLSVL